MCCRLYEDGRKCDFHHLHIANSTHPADVKTIVKKNPACAEKPYALESRDGFSKLIVIVLFALVFDGSEIKKDAYRRIGQAHVVP